MATLGPRPTGPGARSGPGRLPRRSRGCGAERTSPRRLDADRRRARSGRLALAGIRSSQLKGPALGQLLYDDLGRRPSSDIDLLVATAGAASCGAGGARPGLPGARRPRPTAPGYRCFTSRCATALACCRLWSFTGACTGMSSALPRSACSSQPAQTPRAGARPRVDQLAALLLFYARDGFMNLRHAIDVGAFWERHGEGIPDGALEELARAYPSCASPTGLSAVAARSVGLPADRLSENAAQPRRARSPGGAPRAACPQRERSPDLRGHGADRWAAHAAIGSGGVRAPSDTSSASALARATGTGRTRLGRAAHSGTACARSPATARG